VGRWHRAEPTSYGGVFTFDWDPGGHDEGYVWVRRPQWRKVFGQSARYDPDILIYLSRGDDGAWQAEEADQAAFLDARWSPP